MHPIFKEIRETIKSIEATQKSLGLDGEYIRALENAQTGLRRIGQDKNLKGMSEIDFRDRWNNTAFKDGMGLRDPENRPQLRRINGKRSS